LVDQYFCCLKQIQEITKLTVWFSPYILVGKVSRHVKGALMSHATLQEQVVACRRNRSRLW